jgi:hypothetical protein
LGVPPSASDDTLQLMKKRFEFDDATFERVMKLPKKSWRDYPNYKREFERLRPLFAILVAAGRVPRSFYLKFCFPNQMGEEKSG